MKIKDLKNKKVVIFGLGVEGFSTARFLDEKGVGFTIAEKKGLEALPSDVRDFVMKNGIPFNNGETHDDNLKDFEFIFRNPGIPLWNPRLQEAFKYESKVTSQTKLFFDLCPCPIIGVTGTKGKGTTATLIYEMLKASGIDVYLGGNIGSPPLDFLERLKSDSRVVLELSSFQLEDLDKSPHIAVVLMVTSEHLNSQSADSPNYHLSIADYLKAKKNIVKFQKIGDIAVVNSDFSNSAALVSGTKSKVIFFSTEKKLSEGSYVSGDDLVVSLDEKNLRLGKVSDVFLRGPHNLQNVLAASTASLLCGASPSAVREVVKTFKGLEHRLEFVREMGGVKFYNDSFSTTPETAIAAIHSFTEPEIVILGGSDKKSDYTELGRVIVRLVNIKAVILIGFTADKIKDAISRGFRGLNPKKGLNPIEILEGGKSMKDIVRKSLELAKDGDVILLSPACASFDMFKSYKDRGQQFKDCVNQL